jgi:hypothetical protein
MKAAEKVLAHGKTPYIDKTNSIIIFPKHQFILINCLIFFMTYSSSPIKVYKNIYSDVA